LVNLSQLLMVGLPADNDLSFVREFNPAGVILMGRNARPASQIRALSEQLSGMIVASDHEGGRVQRLKDGFSIVPPAREVGQGGAENVKRTAQLVAGELQSAGINFNFAPVCDVPVHEGDTVIGARAFSTDFARAGELASAYVEGLQSGNVGACAKHFPGHGGVGVDSHLGLPIFEGTREELEPHLLPFRAAIEAGVGAMMVAHIQVPCLEETGAPASLSRPIITELLREELGFVGLVVSDDLEMGALAQLGAGEIAVRALQAGSDLLLFCHTQSKAIEARDAIQAALESGRLERGRVEDALEQVGRFKRRFGR
jgi:beta-N-acetylhexosaminidase